ncbi:MAG TPA: hypothetical protein VLH60_02990 [Sedimentisphaerales bacterium]|nr:hypothetical protein [Sedimentisphaerales bacterium]
MRNQMTGFSDSARRWRGGAVLTLIVMAIMVLAIIGAGMLTISYGVQQRAITVQNEAAALMAAEAGYERAIYWMSQQNDVLIALATNAPGSSGTLSFNDSSSSYSVEFSSFINATPVYRVTSIGVSGGASRTVAVDVIQAITGWAMGSCRIPSGTSTTSPVNFVTGEIIDMPLHINRQNDSPDNRDIHISGTPDFRARVSMGEARRTTGGSDKYSTVMNLFDAGIYFNQPDSKITDPSILQARLGIFRQTILDQKPLQVFTPVRDTTITGTGGTTLPAVHIEFFRGADGDGYVRITNNCTVVAGRRTTAQTFDFMVDPTNPNQFINYNVYAYHYAPRTTSPLHSVTTMRVADAKVTPMFGGKAGIPGGKIFVDGNVVLGGDTASIVQGTMTIAATGNIWIANSVRVSDTDDAGNSFPRPPGMLEPPRMDNPNALGLVAQGVIKVIDPGMSNYGPSSRRGVGVEVAADRGNSVYRPVGIGTGNNRMLPNDVEIEAGLTIGGGGWGAENVRRTSSGNTFGDRRENTGSQDNLFLRGTIQEVVRGVVGIVGTDGFLKHYIMDQRMMQGILPGNIWLQGKFIPAPAGWHDYR